MTLLGVLSLGETSWEKPFIIAKVVQKFFFLETMLDNVVFFFVLLYILEGGKEGIDS